MKKGEFGADTLLWDIVSLIERKRAEAGVSALQGSVAVASSKK